MENYKIESSADGEANFQTSKTCQIIFEEKKQVDMYERKVRRRKRGKFRHLRPQIELKERSDERTDGQTYVRTDGRVPVNKAMRKREREIGFRTVGPRNKISASVRPKIRA